MTIYDSEEQDHALVIGQSIRGSDVMNTEVPTLSVEKRYKKMIEKLDEEEKQLKLNKTFDNQLKKNIGSSLLNAVTIAEVGRMPSGVLKEGLMLTEGNQINNINC